MSDAIVKHEAVGVGQVRQMWTPERVDLIKRVVCPKGISDDGFALFLEQCKRSELDPLLKEAFCVERRQNIGTRDKPVWAFKHEFQPSEAGMLARSERFPDFRGIQASAVYAEDEIIIDQGKGEVVHRFNPAKRKGSLVGAWARVVREGKVSVVVWLDFAGYVQQTPLWSKIPTTMIEKCARVSALRKAYPEAFGGLYIREEMPEEKEEAPKPAKVRAIPPPEDAPTREEDATIEGMFTTAVQQVTGKAPDYGDADTHVQAGPSKGKAISTLDKASVDAAIHHANTLLEDPKHAKAKSRPRLERNVLAMNARRTELVPDRQDAMDDTGPEVEHPRKEAAWMNGEPSPGERAAIREREADAER